MQYSKVFIATIAASMALTLGACAQDNDKATNTKTSEKSDSSAAGSAVVPEQMPTVEQLNAILATATDPAATIEQKTATVQGGETAPELFDTMARLKEESGANFQVVDPILPNAEPNSVLTTLSLTYPDQEPQTVENVIFVYEDGVWKISQDWACTLISVSLGDAQLPPMCVDHVAPAAPEAAAPEAPVSDAPAAEAPAPEAPAAQ
ncbi:hypothetical protein EML15_02075 [Corynebacterium sp. sy017]|uniref:hypothetical protein n=1 Tax=unclassified Corynebacterium TaxID=2624378 RepID=UPI001184A278|nr:hypothetical protein [Corynebacterium sp. SY003]MBP3087945.1 hypothetical protein [Corynebacterium sp. sy017]TSD92480.1 hypothetical protein ELY17_02075 [Corynebacterium sp. SY003]